MTYKLVFRVRREYFDAIVAGKKTMEFRRINPYWATRACAVERELKAGHLVIATFICGRSVHRARVKDFTFYNTAAEALGREPSAQGRLDLGDGPVYAFVLG